MYTLVEYKFGSYWADMENGGGRNLNKLETCAAFMILKCNSVYLKRSVCEALIHGHWPTLCWKPDGSPKCHNRQMCFTVDLLCPSIKSSPQYAASIPANSFHCSFAAMSFLFPFLGRSRQFLHPNVVLGDSCSKPRKGNYPCPRNSAGEKGSFLVHQTA